MLDNFEAEKIAYIAEIEGLVKGKFTTENPVAARTMLHAVQRPAVLIPGYKHTFDRRLVATGEDGEFRSQEVTRSREPFIVVAAQAYFNSLTESSIFAARAAAGGLSEDELMQVLQNRSSVDETMRFFGVILGKREQPNPVDMTNQLAQEMEEPVEITVIETVPVPITYDHLGFAQFDVVTKPSRSRSVSFHNPHGQFTCFRLRDSHYDQGFPLKSLKDLDDKADMVSSNHMEVLGTRYVELELKKPRDISRFDPFALVDVIDHILTTGSK